MNNKNKKPWEIAYSDNPTLAEAFYKGMGSPKFVPGDDVWLIHNNKVYSGCVSEIHLKWSYSPFTPYIKYDVTLHGDFYDEYSLPEVRIVTGKSDWELFGTLEELKKNLFEGIDEHKDV